MRNVKRIMSRVVAIIIATLTLTSCYHTTTRQHEANTGAFYQKHHYAQNYNFVVKADSLASC